MALAWVASSRWETNEVLHPPSMGAVEERRAARRACWKVCVAVEERVAVCWVDHILVLGSADENTGESRTPAVAGVVDGGTFGCRSLVGGIDVATLIRLP